MFMEELWGLLVDAQSSLGGIPSAFLQDKKDEMAQAKVPTVMMLIPTIRLTRAEYACTVSWRAGEGPVAVDLTLAPTEFPPVCHVVSVHNRFYFSSPPVNRRRSSRKKRNCGEGWLSTRRRCKRPLR